MTPRAIPRVTGRGFIRDVSVLPSDKPIERMILQAPRIPAPNMDGTMTHPAWRKALKLEQFFLYPMKAKDHRRTEARIGYDDTYIYVGFRCWDDMSKALFSEPRKVVDGKLEREREDGERVQAYFTPASGDSMRAGGALHSARNENADRRGPGADQTPAYCPSGDWFVVSANPIGMRFDATLLKLESWDGTWKQAGATQADSWTVEIAFPFSDVGLSGPPMGKAWGLNLVRNGDFTGSITGETEDPRRFAILCFGDAIEFLSREKTELSLIADREEYDPVDVTAVALAKITTTRRSLSGARLQILLVDQTTGAVVRESTISPIKPGKLDMTLDLRDVPPDRYRLVGELLNHKGELIAQDVQRFWKMPRRPQNQPAAREKIPITVWKSHTPSDEAWPISTGVPLPQNVLWSPDNVRLLDAEGKEVSCQVSVRSTWNREGSVRWLGLDFQSPLEQKARELTLEFGSEVKRAQVRKPLKVTDAKDDIRVDTGPLKFIVRKRRFNLLDDVRLNGRRIATQHERAGLELTDHEGNVYRAANDANASVTIEERGPLKTVIRAEGWYVKDRTRGKVESPVLPTDKLCKHITRITAYAGKPYVTVQHALVITFDTNKVALRNVAITQAFDAKTVAFGLDMDVVSVDVNPKESTRLVQHSWNRTRVEREITYRAAYLYLGPMEKEIRSGRESDGWFRATGPSGSVVTCVRDLAQMFPKELEVCGGRIMMHIWPQHGKVNPEICALDPKEVYHLWWAHQGKTLSLKTPDDVVQSLWQYPGGGAYPAYVLNSAAANGIGIAVEHNMLLHFQEPGLDDLDANGEAAQLNAIFQLEPHAMASPEWMCASGALGPMVPALAKREKYPGAANFAEYETKVRLAAQEHARDFGMFNWQDVHADNSRFVNGTWTLNRIWNAGHHGTTRVPWYLYAASGEPEYLAFGRRNARHVMNVDVIHYEPQDYDVMAGVPTRGWHLQPRFGAMYHCKTVPHWGGDSFVADHLISFDFMMWDWFMTGNHRACEVAFEWRRAIKELSPFGFGKRDGMTIICELVELFQATWDAGLLELINRFARAVETEPLAIQGWVSYAPFLLRYLPFSGEQRMRERAIEWIPENAMDRLTRNAALYFDSRDAKWLMPPETKEAEEFFRNLPKDPKPIPVIDDTMKIGAWYFMSYPIQYMLPYLAAAEEAGVAVPPPEK